MKGRKVRIGFIGAGWWATVTHLPLLKVRNDTELVGVCGLDAKVLAAVQARFEIPFATTDVHELLRHELDGVIVSSPHRWHHEHARLALEGGCHVLCEKPMALDPGEAWKLVDLARARARQIMIPYGWNYKSFVPVARQWVEEGLLGKIEYVTCHMASPAIGLFAGDGTVPESWKPDLARPDLRTWQDKAAGGGYAHGQITHSSALLFWITGLRAKQVDCLMTDAGAAVDLYDAACVEFDGGVIGTVSGGATLPDNDRFQVDLRIFGDQGVLLLDLERGRLELRRRDGAHRQHTVTNQEAAYSCEGPPNRFIDLIKGEGTNDSPGELGAKTVELIDAMHRSAREGRRVTVR